MANEVAVKVNKTRRKRVASREGNFFSDLSFADLAASQKIKPTKNAVELNGGFPDDEDIDQFLDEVYRARK